MHITFIVREHLSEEDLQNKTVLDSITKAASTNTGPDGLATALSDTNPPPTRRESLPPPVRSKITWLEYCRAGKCPVLGRDIVCKENTKAFKATLAMSEDFPLTIDALLNVLEVIAPFKQFSKLREFVECKLPPGFPVKIGERFSYPFLCIL